MKDKKGLLMIVSGILGWIVWFAGFYIWFLWAEPIDGARYIGGLPALLVGAVPFLLSLIAIWLGVRSIMKKERKWISVIIGLIISLPLAFVSGVFLALGIMY